LATLPEILQRLVVAEVVGTQLHDRLGPLTAPELLRAFDPPVELLERRFYHAAGQRQARLAVAAVSCSSEVKEVPQAGPCEPQRSWASFLAAAAMTGRISAGMSTFPVSFAISWSLLHLRDETITDFPGLL